MASGFIGLDNPRYCLFGDAINVASRLSTTGEPSKIQISTECHKMLEKVGGYVTQERGIIDIKGKHSLKTYWLVKAASSTN